MTEIQEQIIQNKEMKPIWPASQSKFEANPGIPKLWSDIQTDKPEITTFVFFKNKKRLSKNLNEIILIAKTYDGKYILILSFLE